MYDIWNIERTQAASRDCRCRSALSFQTRVYLVRIRAPDLPGLQAPSAEGVQVGQRAALYPLPGAQETSRDNCGERPRWVESPHSAPVANTDVIAARLAPAPTRTERYRAVLLGVTAGVGLVRCLAWLFRLLAADARVRPRHEERLQTGFARDARGPSAARSRCGQHCARDPFPSLPTHLLPSSQSGIKWRGLSLARPCGAAVAIAFPVLQ